MDFLAAVIRLVSADSGTTGLLAPDRSNEIVLGHDPIAVFDQIDRQIKGLRLNADSSGRAAVRGGPASGG